MSHTPGPWEFRNDSSMLVHVTSTVQTDVVCEFEVHGDLSEENAVLIQHAPELLKALRALVTLNDMRCIGGCPTCDARDLLERLKDL